MLSMWLCIVTNAAGSIQVSTRASVARIVGAGSPCTSPDIQTGYIVTEHALAELYFNVSVRCSSGYIPSGAPRAISCAATQHDLAIQFPRALPCKETLDVVPNTFLPALPCTNSTYQLEGCVSISTEVCPCDLFCTDHRCDSGAKLKRNAKQILCPNETCTHTICCDGISLGAQACTDTTGTELEVLRSFNWIAFPSCAEHCFRYPTCTAFTYDKTMARCKLHTEFIVAADGVPSSCFVRQFRFSAKWPEGDDVEEDADCPDTNLTSRYKYIRGSPDPSNVIREDTVASCAQCTATCVDSPHCNGYQCVRNAVHYHCKHLDYAIPATREEGFVCVPKPEAHGNRHTCIANYEKRAGFVGDNAGLLESHRDIDCDQCGNVCTLYGRECGMYQCSDHLKDAKKCEIYTKAKKLVRIALDVVVCVKFPTEQCKMQDGTMLHKDDCLCGTDGSTICRNGQRCHVTSQTIIDGTEPSLIVTGTCSNIRPCEVCTRAGCVGAMAHVCADNGQTYANRCEAECVGHEVVRLGTCDGTTNTTHCKETEVDADVVCGSDGNSYLSPCFALATPNVIVVSNGSCGLDQLCHREGDTDCFCANSTSKSYCASSISVPNYCTRSDHLCLPRCAADSGEVDIWETNCICPNSAGTVCNHGAYCVASSGTCRPKPKCGQGDTNCFCTYPDGEEFCSELNYCSAGHLACVPRCADESGKNGVWETGCFCRSNTTLCSSNTYCGEGTCVPGCPYHDGSMKNDHSCICGTNLQCPANTYCRDVHGHQECLDNPLPKCTHPLAEATTDTKCICGTAVCRVGDYCIEHADHDEECLPDYPDCPTSGTDCVSALCGCGEDPCPRGNLCSTAFSSSPTCYPLRQRCTKKYETNCVCGSDHSVCNQADGSAIWACSQPNSKGTCVLIFNPECPEGYQTLNAGTLQPVPVQTPESCASLCSQNTSCAYFALPRERTGSCILFDRLPDNRPELVCGKNCSHSKTTCSAARSICDDASHACRACVPSDCSSGSYCTTDEGCVDRNSAPSLCNDMTNAQTASGTFSRRVCPHKLSSTTCLLSFTDVHIAKAGYPASCKDLCAKDRVRCTNAWRGTDCEQDGNVPCDFASATLSNVVCECAS